MPPDVWALSSCFTVNSHSLCLSNWEETAARTYQRAPFIRLGLVKNNFTSKKPANWINVPRCEHVGWFCSVCTCCSFLESCFYSQLSLMQAAHLDVKCSKMCIRKAKWCFFQNKLCGHSESLNNDFFSSSLNVLTAYRWTLGTTSLTCCLAFLPFHPCLCLWRIYNFSYRFVCRFVWVAAHVCPHANVETPL